MALVHSELHDSLEHTVSHNDTLCMYLAICICLGVFDDVLKLQSSLQQHWLLTGDHLLVNGFVEVGYLHMETGQEKE